MRLWHARLAYLDPRNIASLYKIADGINLSDEPDYIYTDYALTKIISKIHKRALSKSNFPLEIIYADLAGPVDPLGPAGENY